LRLWLGNQPIQPGCFRGWLLSTLTVNSLIESNKQTNKHIG
jgi:hypothetical protein